MGDRGLFVGFLLAITDRGLDGSVGDRFHNVSTDSRQLQSDQTIASASERTTVPRMSESHGERRASLDHERGHLHSQIGELTAGGDADLGFDDDFADRGQVASEQGENRSLADMLRAQLSLVDRALARLDDGSVWHVCRVRRDDQL